MSPSNSFYSFGHWLSPWKIKALEQAQRWWAVHSGPLQVRKRDLLYASQFYKIILECPLERTVFGLHLQLQCVGYLGTLPMSHPGYFAGYHRPHSTYRSQWGYSWDADINRLMEEGREVGGERSGLSIQRMSLAGVGELTRPDGGWRTCQPFECRAITHCFTNWVLPYASNWYIRITLSRASAGCLPFASLLL